MLAALLLFERQPLRLNYPLKLPGTTYLEKFGDLGAKCVRVRREVAARHCADAECPTETRRSRVISLRHLTDRAKRSKRVKCQPPYGG